LLTHFYDNLFNQRAPESGEEKKKGFCGTFEHFIYRF
jgi:hypothetical protein